MIHYLYNIDFRYEFDIQPGIVEITQYNIGQDTPLFITKPIVERARVIYDDLVKKGYKKTPNEVII
jgi:hypothetical protein